MPLKNIGSYAVIQQYPLLYSSYLNSKYLDFTRRVWFLGKRSNKMHGLLQGGSRKGGTQRALQRLWKMKLKDVILV